jgi:hypothetical protein
MAALRRKAVETRPSSTCGMTARNIVEHLIDILTGLGQARSLFDNLALLIGGLKPWRPGFLIEAVFSASLSLVARFGQAAASYHGISNIGSSRNRVGEFGV